MSAEDWRLPLTLLAIGALMFVIGRLLAIAKGVITHERARRGHSVDEQGRSYDWRRLYPELRSWNYQTWVGVICLFGAVVSALAVLVGVIFK